MSIQARVQLKFPKQFKTLCLEYHTFEKASFDQYLAASIAYRTIGVRQSNNYIDDLTGQGSLNEHFKKIVSKVREFSKESIKKILENSLFPMTKIDKTNKFLYYPMFDISVLNNRIFKDVSKYSLEELKDELLLDYDIINTNIEVKELDEKYESYSVRFSKDKNEILIAESWIPLEKNLLSECCKKQEININKYPGRIDEVVDGDDWILLSDAYFNTLFARKGFLDKDNNYCILTNDYIKVTEIVKIAELYFYREKKIEFTKENRYYCELVLNNLYNNSMINEIKTKTLVQLLDASSDITTQAIINYVLSRKSSKELAIIGMKLIKNGLEKNWELEALNGIKEFAISSDYNILYKINNIIKFEIHELAKIDSDILSIEDRKKKEDYLNERKNKTSEIQRVLGIIADSGLRENIKKVLNQSDHKVKQFNKYCNELLAHSSKSSDDLSDEQLNNKYKKILEFYNLYLEIQKMYNDKK